MDDDYIDFQAGSLLTAAELNLFDTWQLYIDQELDDSKAGIDGTVPGAAVKSVTGLIPIVVENTDPQQPVVAIEETFSIDDPNSLTSDTKVMSEKAIDAAFSQVIGTGADYPAPGYTGKVGRLRINPDTTIPGFFYWNGTAWIQVATKGETGDQGPPGPAPGLQDPPATAVTIPLNGDGTLGTATADVQQDPSTSDLKFLFGIPAGQKGDKGDTGADSTVPGPPPGLQGNAAVANNVANNPDGSIGQATASVTADANKDLQFTFGIPVGERGPIGPPGDGVDYKGKVDATSDAEPGTKRNGDFYVNTGTGTSTWTGLSTVSINDRLVWNGNTNVWDVITPPPVTGVDLDYVAAPGQGTVENSAGTNAVLPAVDATNAGLMIPAQYTKLNGIEAGAEVNPNLDNYLQSGDNVSELTNDAGYITAGDVPTPATPTLQSVLDEGNTSTTDLWIGANGESIRLLKEGRGECSRLTIDTDPPTTLATKSYVDLLGLLEGLADTAINPPVVDGELLAFEGDYRLSGCIKAQAGFEGYIQFELPTGQTGTVTQKITNEIVGVIGFQFWNGKWGHKLELKTADGTTMYANATVSEDKDVAMKAFYYIVGTGLVCEKSATLGKWKNTDEVKANTYRIDLLEALP
jgi:hypothetical protein